MAYPTISRHALLVGASALVPLPFIDWLLRRRLLSRVYGELATASGVTLTGQQRRLLLAERGNLAVGCLAAGLWWPIKKLFRTVVFVLLIKDAADWAAEAAVRALLVRSAAERGLLPERAADVGAIIDRVVREGLGSPVVRLLRPAPHPPAAWEQAPGVLGAFVRELVRYAGGPDVLEAGEAALAGLGVAQTPEPPR